MHRAEAVEQQVTAAVGQLQQSHVELHRRSEMLRQKTRTLYLIDKVLTVDNQATESAATGGRSARTRWR